MSAEQSREDATNRHTTWDGRPSHEPRAVGTTVARYVILEALGRGGMGAVYRAYDPKLRREIALKVLHPGAMNEELVLAEARAMAQHTHASLVSVYDADRLESEVYIAMELVRGSTLASWMNETHPWREVVAMFGRIAAGISVAHAAGIVHRDIKPANVLLDQLGHPKIADFGLAAPDADRPTQPTPWVEPNERMPAMAAGTPAYMPPEQHRGEPVTAASDQFAFCVALHEALYGRRPFVADSAVDLLSAKNAGPTPPAPSLERDVPRWLWPIVRQGLAADAADRWPSMQTLAAALARDPGRQRRRTALIVASLGLVGGIPLAKQITRARARDACMTDVDPATPWGPDAKDRLRTALLGTGEGYAERTAATVETQLDVLAEDWTEARRRACLDANVDRTVAASDASLIDTCLDQRRRAIVATVESLAGDPPGLLPYAVNIVGEIETPSTCLDLDRLRLATPLSAQIADSPSREAIAHDLERAEAALQDDALGELDDILNGVRQRLAAEPWPNAAVTEQILRARAADRAGDLQAAIAGFRAATATAMSIGCDRCAIDPGLRLLGALAESDVEARTVDEWATMVSALIERAGLADDPMMADVHSAVGIAYVTSQEYGQARTAFEAAVDIQRRVYGPDHPSVVADETNLAIALGGLGHYDEAIELSQRTLDATVRWYGDGHPDLAPILQCIGRAESALGHHDKAIAAMERALGIEEAHRPPGHPTLLLALNNLAGMHSNAGDTRSALVYAKRIATESDDAPAADRLLALTNVGWYHYELAELDEARAVLETGLTLSLANPRAVRGGRSISSNLGRVYLAMDRPKRAAEQFQRALDIGRNAWGQDSPRLAEDWEGLARAELDQVRLPEASEALRTAASLVDDEDTTTSKQIEDTRARLQAAQGSGNHADAPQHATSDPPRP